MNTIQTMTLVYYILKVLLGASIVVALCYLYVYTKDEISLWLEIRREERFKRWNDDDDYFTKLVSWQKKQPKPLW